MNEAEVITRKEHECCVCGGIIPKASKALFYSGKAARYDDNDNQIGIEYYRNWLHDFRCDLTTEQREKCANGEHIYEPEYELAYYVDCHPVYDPTGNDYCAVCGIRKAA